MKIDYELERELIIKAKQGSNVAFSRLIKMHEFFLIGICKKYSILKLEFEEKYQMCRLAFMEAVNKFQFERNIKFLSFAAIYIRKEFGAYINFHECQKRDYTMCRSLSTLIVVDEKPLELQDAIAAPEIDVDDQEMIFSKVDQAIDKINDSSRKKILKIIMKMLRNDEEITLEAIGQQIGLTRERVRQIKLKFSTIPQLRILRRELTR